MMRQKPKEGDCVKYQRANLEVRQEALRAGVRHWRIADELGISEMKLCRMLRHELPEAEKRRILEAIDRLKGGVGA